ncbi:GNAT family N-acetyltransferase [Shewanella sp. AS16]|uniref:GNAT family N-acetyltransferase n=1 Tax=Shewanella sp. AS16 TaxID=2907625 RepID=UPI001F3F155D|nr:GNAT family N-acetyltransferase [Shewanella sp. AS16]MCE9684954.1 GNAT family N-acetyltransferase [Shewanella sp. AS16]
MIELYSDRLRLRCLRDEDWPAFLYVHQDPDINRYVRQPDTGANIRSKFEQRSQPWVYGAGEWLTLVIEEIDSQQTIGFTGLYCQDFALAHAEVGYLLLPQAYGKGYATESLRAVIDWACLSFDVHKFIGHCAQDNKASARVLEKCGFQLEGILRHNFKIGDVWIDDCAYGLLAEERLL